MVRKREATARGLLLTLIVHTWFGWLPASFLASWGAMALTLAATASAIVGLRALVGRAGIAVGAILTMFVGNPLSSLAMPKEPGGRSSESRSRSSVVTVTRRSSTSRAWSSPILPSGARPPVAPSPHRHPSPRG